MAKRKGISKTKTSAKKSILENATNTIATDNSSCLKDESNGGGRPPSTMEIVQNKLVILEQQKHQQLQNQQQQIIQLELPNHQHHNHQIIKQQQQHHQNSLLIQNKQNNLNQLTNSSNTISSSNNNCSKIIEENNFSDLKYLHKKFKRLASSNNSNIPAITTTTTSSSAATTSSLLTPIQITTNEQNPFSNTTITSTTTTTTKPTSTILDSNTFNSQEVIPPINITTTSSNQPPPPSPSTSLSSYDDHLNSSQRSLKPYVDYVKEQQYETIVNSNSTTSSNSNLIVKQSSNYSSSSSSNNNSSSSINNSTSIPGLVPNGHILTPLIQQTPQTTNSSSFFLTNNNNNSLNNNFKDNRLEIVVNNNNNYNYNHSVVGDRNENRTSQQHNNPPQSTLLAGAAATIPSATSLTTTAVIQLPNNNNIIYVSLPTSHQQLPSTNTIVDQKHQNHPHHQHSATAAVLQLTPQQLLGVTVATTDNINTNNSLVYTTNSVIPLQHQAAKIALTEATTVTTSHYPQQQQTVSTTTISSSTSTIASLSAAATSTSSVNTTSSTVTSGRHVCPYCLMVCSKPSVLQKHIRAHTNERPYPCGPCKCAFKTKSNLYKHQRSRTHVLRTQGIEPLPEDEASVGSDQEQDQDLNSSHSFGSDLHGDRYTQIDSPMDVDRVLSPAAMQHHHLQQQQLQQQQQQQILLQSNIVKPYKPKFSGLYNVEDIRLAPQNSGGGGPSSSTAVSFTKNLIPIQSHSTPPKNLEVAEHISRLISDNEAIVEGGKPPVQKKSSKVQSPKLGGQGRRDSESRQSIPSLVNRSASVLCTASQGPQNISKSTPPSLHNHVAQVIFQQTQQQHLQQQQQQLQIQQQMMMPQTPPVEMLSNHHPLNLTKDLSAQSQPTTSQQMVAGPAPRQRTHSEEMQQDQDDVPNHPQNPEKSIIKNLLLNPKNFGSILGGEDTKYKCPFCKISFRNAEKLKYHTTCHCKGSLSDSPHSTPAISPSASPSAHQYYRSNSYTTPNSLAKLASTSLRQQPYKSTPRSLQHIVKSQIKSPASASPSSSRPRLENITINTGGNFGEGTSKGFDFVSAPLPSPGPLLGNTRMIGDKPTTHAMPELSVRVESPSILAPHTPNPHLNHNFTMPHMQGGEMTSHRHRSGISTTMGGLGNLHMFGGELKIIEKKNDLGECFSSYGSGGSIKSLSPTSDPEPSPIHSRSGGSMCGGYATQLVSTPSAIKDGGILQNTPPTPKFVVTIAPSLGTTIMTPSLSSSNVTHFHFPPINSITAYNPLTLPPMTSTGQPATILHGGKMIPFVPGIPGPNTGGGNLLKTDHHSPRSRVISPIRMKNIPSPLTLPQNNSSGMYTSLNNSGLPRVSPVPGNFNSVTHRPIPNIKITDEDTPVKSSKKSLYGGKNGIKESPTIWSPAKKEDRKFNFARMADNLSPRKPGKSPEAEIRHFNYENLISKTAILIKPPADVLKQTQPLHVDVRASPSPSKRDGGGTLLIANDTKEMASPVGVAPKSNKFLRPNSLPLKPGTFTQKKHHGITPTMNTMPLISPETPRPFKNCVQQYLNGHAYTYLGLKCSTKMSYCTLNHAQPVYCQLTEKLSMYSEWRTQVDYDPHPLGITHGKVIALYDSRHRPNKYSIARSRHDMTTVVNSQATIMTPFESSTTAQGDQYAHHQISPIPPPRPPQSVENDRLMSPSTGGSGSVSGGGGSGTLPGGYESNEDYTYVRGRGRGRYVCSKCGIRCKKPSMLKKHLRTHTDVRPYTCKMCSFSFKTKGNLTKHMKSKTHYKKCVELGLNPVPPSGDDDSNEMYDNDQLSMTGSGRTSTVPDDSDTDTDSDGDDVDSESSDTDESKSRSVEHEAARCLISLSMTPPNSGGGGGGGLPYSSERVITTFASPKSDFNLLKHDQYYSNPNLLGQSVATGGGVTGGRKSHADTESTDESMPIDLTKPKERENHRRGGVDRSADRNFSKTQQPPRQIISEFAPLNPACLLKSIVSMVDKIQTPTNNNNTILANPIDDSKLQQYLTERALQESKMKQSQMIRTQKNNNDEDNVISSTPTVTSRPFQNIEYGGASTPTTPSIETKRIVEEIEEKSIQQTQPIQKPSQQKDEVVGVSSMDTLAEIAASSVKLDVSSASSTSMGKCVVATTSQAATAVTTIAGATGTANDNAKSVASEYLKMAVKETKRSNKSSMTEDDEPASDSDDSNGKLMSTIARNVVVGEDGFKNPVPDHPSNLYSAQMPEDGRAQCNVCSKTFQKKYHLVLHYNIHYLERKFRCEPCGISFRTKGHLQKHERSVQHYNKVSMTSTFGVATTSNPRPFKCSDCKVAFRIHGHLAKHLRSKMHVMKLECNGKLPFGMYAEIERAGVSLTDIDTTDCDNSLTSLLQLAHKLHEKDPSKFGNWQPDPHSLRMIEQQNESGGVGSGAGSAGRIRETDDSDDSDAGLDDHHHLNHHHLHHPLHGSENSARDSAFSSDSSSGSIKRKIDAIAGSLEPPINGESNEGDHKRLKTLSDI